MQVVEPSLTASPMTFKQKRRVSDPMILRGFVREKKE